jgi:hypothetical protein
MMRAFASGIFPSVSSSRRGTGDEGQETRDKETRGDEGQTKQPPMNRNNGANGGYFVCATSSIFPEPFDAARAGYSGQVPALRPERLISVPFSPDPKGTQKISMTVP